MFIQILRKLWVGGCIFFVLPNQGFCCCWCCVWWLETLRQWDIRAWGDSVGVLMELAGGTLQATSQGAGIKIFLLSHKSKWVEMGVLLIEFMLGFLINPFSRCLLHYAFFSLWREQLGTVVNINYIHIYVYTYI